MAEGSGIEGVLDSEPEDREAAAAGAGADAVALSLALQKASEDPELSRAASEYRSLSTAKCAMRPMVIFQSAWSSPALNPLKSGVQAQISIG